MPQSFNPSYNNKKQLFDYMLKALTVQGFSSAAAFRIAVSLTNSITANQSMDSPEDNVKLIKESISDIITVLQLTQTYLKLS